MEENQLNVNEINKDILGRLMTDDLNMHGRCKDGQLTRKDNEMTMRNQKETWHVDSKMGKQAKPIEK